MLVPSGFFCSLLSFTLHETKVGFYGCEYPASQELSPNLDEKKTAEQREPVSKLLKEGKLQKRRRTMEVKCCRFYVPYMKLCDTT